MLDNLVHIALNQPHIQSARMEGSICKLFCSLGKQNTVHEQNEWSKEVDHEVNSYNVQTVNINV